MRPGLSESSSICFFFFFLFLVYFQPSQIGCLPYLHTWCGLSANLGCRSETCCTRLAEIQDAKNRQLECGPMPNVMAALPNIGGALCSTPQSLADAQYWNAVQQRCQDAKPVEICRGAPNSPTDLSAASGPKFTILWGHVEEILLLNKFFSIVDTCLICEDIARQIAEWCPDGDILAIFASCISSEPRAARFRPAFQIRTMRPH